jgi:hypothetical protein
VRWPFVVSLGLDFEAEQQHAVEREREVVKGEDAKGPSDIERSHADVPAGLFLAEQKCGDDVA